MKPLTHLIVGGGAAGFFGAIECARQNPSDKVIIIEKTRQLLSKVRISGGGRCNVTHACFDPAALVKNYPRGYLELRGPFTRFQPLDTIQWFESRGVSLKVEDDGRMFPTTDSSETIIQCLMTEAKKKGVEILLESGLEVIEQQDNRFLVRLSSGLDRTCDRILMTTGSNAKIQTLLNALGHTIIPAVPSLFTFNLPSSPFLDLSGISLDSVKVTLPDYQLEQTGPLLFTHWGLSGPAVLKLSAFAARELSSCQYQTSVICNWLPGLSEKAIQEKLTDCKKRLAAKLIASDSVFELPKQLWKKLLSLSGCHEDLRWAMLPAKSMQALISHLHATTLQLSGKTTYKQEFVTCGGINLQEVNFKTMESKKIPHLYFAGEILNIDGITGGFNFQNAWTTGWIAGQSMGDER